MNTIKIELKTIEDPIELNGKKHVLCEVEKLSKLLEDNIKLKGQNNQLLAESQNHEKEVNELREVICSILDVLGLYDKETGDIKESIKKGEETYLKPIIKSIGDLMRLLTLSSLSSKYKSELENKFAFIQKIFPIVEKYAKHRS